MGDVVDYSLVNTGVSSTSSECIPALVVTYGLSLVGGSTVPEMSQPTVLSYAIRVQDIHSKITNRVV